MDFLQLPSTTLRDFAKEILKAWDVPEDHALLVSESLVAANLRGVDSHGVQMLLPYIEQFETGTMDPRATGRLLSESGACLVYDGEYGIGQVIADRATDELLRAIPQSGLCMVVVRNSNHFGACAYWAEKLVRGGYIGIVMTNSSPAVPPWQGKAARFGTNPICMAVPSNDGQGWLLDMATTTVALGKMYDAAFRGQTSLPAGWAMDRDGTPTTDTKAALDGFPLPLGGYKGSGLAMLVDILCATLSGGPMAAEVGSLRAKQVLKISHMFLAIDPERFGGVDAFKDRLAKLVEMVKATPPASGYQEVLVAGEPEWRMERHRMANGIPIPLPLWEQLSAVAKRMNVTVPL